MYKIISIIFLIFFIFSCEPKQPQIWIEVGTVKEINTVTIGGDFLSRDKIKLVVKTEMTTIIDDSTHYFKNSPLIGDKVYIRNEAIMDGAKFERPYK